MGGGRSPRGDDCWCHAGQLRWRRRTLHGCDRNLDMTAEITTMADRDRQDEAEGRMLPKWYMQLAGVITGVAFTLALLAAGYLAFRVWVMGLAPFSLEALTVASMVLTLWPPRDLRLLLRLRAGGHDGAGACGAPASSVGPADRDGAPPGGRLRTGASALRAGPRPRAGGRLTARAQGDPGPRRGGRARVPPGAPARYEGGSA